MNNKLLSLRMLLVLMFASIVKTRLNPSGQGLTSVNVCLGKLSEAQSTGLNLW